jgi:methyltransferase (TIGR00027 family)
MAFESGQQPGMAAGRAERKRSATGVAALRYLGSFERAPEVRNPDRFVGRLLPSYMARLARVPPARLAIRSFIDRRYPGSRRYHVARTKFIDDVVISGVRERGMRQVVILGAGLDTRAWRLAALTDNAVRVFELDHPTTSRQKQIAIHSASLARRPRFVDIDFTTQDFPSELARAGWDRNRRALFVWEGVSMFLTTAVVDRMLRQIGGAPAGSEIVFDYVFRDVIEGASEPYGARAARRYLQRGGEWWRFGVNHEDIPALLSRYGLSTLNNYGPKDLQAHYLRLRNGRSDGRVLGFHGLAHAVVLPSETGTIQRSETHTKQT